jgi:hypothetical protein
MITLPVWLCLGISAQPVDAHSLQLFQGSFIVRKGEAKDVVPLKLAKPDPVLAKAYRRNKTFAVWDERGLTIRVGQRKFTTQLEEVAVTPKLFEKSEIDETVSLLAQKKRKRQATALAGSVRIGTDVYFLPRWLNSDGTAWLEALVKVDLTQANPKPQLLGRFSGISLADQAIDDRLFMLQDKLSVVTRQRGVWGLAQYTPKTEMFDFTPVGASLGGYRQLSPRFGLYLEKTSYGTQTAGKVDWFTQNRRILVETRGNVRIADPFDAPILILSENGIPYIVNADTGARQQLPASSAVRRCKFGVVVWSPFDSPRRAWLYDPDRWRALARMPAVPISER